MTGLNVRPAMEKAGLAKGASTVGAVTVLDGSSFALQVASRFSVPYKKKNPDCSGLFSVGLTLNLSDGNTKAK
jgi:hypothetical protein